MDDEGRVTDVALFRAIETSGDPERLIRMFAFEDYSVGFRVDLTLDWSFSQHVDWSLLPTPFLHQLCDFLNARDILSLKLTCRTVRDKLSKMNTVSQGLDAFLDVKQRLENGIIAHENRRLAEQRARKRQKMKEFFGLLVVVLLGGILVVSQAVIGIVGLGFFSRLSREVSVVPDINASLVLSLLFGVCGLFIFNTVLLLIFLGRVVTERQCCPHGWSLGDLFVLCNSLGLLSNVCVVVLSGLGVSETYFLINEELFRRSYAWLSFTVGFGSFVLALQIFITIITWSESYKRIGSFRHFLCCSC